jgi:hypothetical protein
VLAPSGIVGLLGNYTNVETTILRSLFSASGWNLDDLTLSLRALYTLPAGDDTRLTLFAPIDSVLDSLFSSDGHLERITEPLWSRHLAELLANLLVSTAYTRDELLQEEEPLATLGGTSVSLVRSGNDLQIAAGNVLSPSMSGVDG